METRKIRTGIGSDFFVQEALMTPRSAATFRVMDHHMWRYSPECCHFPSDGPLFVVLFAGVVPLQSNDSLICGAIRRRAVDSYMYFEEICDVFFHITN